MKNKLALSLIVAAFMLGLITNESPVEAHESRYGNDDTCARDINSIVQPNAATAYSNYQDYRPLMIKIELCKLQLLDQIHKMQHETLSKSRR